MKKLAIKEWFYVTLVILIIAISFFVIKSGDDERDLSSLFIKNVIENTLAEGNSLKIEDKEIPNKYLTPSKYYEINEDEIKKQIEEKKEKQRKERLKNEKKTKEQAEEIEAQSNIEQFSSSGVKKTMEVTMYTANYESTGKTPDHPQYGITASGNKVKSNHTIACPPRLEFGTEIYIPHFDNTYVCQDRGSAITNGHLDVYVKSLDKALTFGRRNLKVIIYE